MARAKATQVKRPKAKAKVETAHEEETPEPVSTKNKKSFDLDEPEIALGIEEKNDEELAPGEDDEELAGEEISLDDEELNPFGDKWEE